MNNTISSGFKFDSSMLSPKRPRYPVDKNGYPSPTLNLKSPRMIRSKYTNDGDTQVAFRGYFNNRTTRLREKVEDQKVFVYDPPRRHGIYRQNTPPPYTGPKDYDVVIEPKQQEDDPAKDTNGPEKEVRGNRILRKKYNFLFLNTLKEGKPKAATAKEQRQFEKKKRNAPTVKVLSNKTERWRHPSVDKAYQLELEQQQQNGADYGVSSGEAGGGTMTMASSSKKKAGHARPPSRLEEDKRSAALSQIRTRLLYNRFDWNGHGRFVPAHKPFNPRMYGNAERIYTTHKLYKAPLQQKHAPVIDKRKSKRKKLVFGAPPGLSTRVPDNATAPPISPLKFVAPPKAWSKLESAWDPLPLNPELATGTLQMQAEECRRNRAYIGKYKPLSNSEFYHFVMSHRKREGGATS
jgi:hypothetical protein|eukprot:g8504.t1